jgi:hypothetical protein
VSGDRIALPAFQGRGGGDASRRLKARAVWLRAAELERLANHLGDIGAICNDRHSA